MGVPLPREGVGGAGWGVLWGRAAAIVPARGAARMTPIDALAQRFRATPLEARVPKLGLALIALGTAGALIASRASAAAPGDYAARLQAAEGTGIWVVPPNIPPHIALRLFRALLGVAGVELVRGACAVDAPKSGLRVEGTTPPREIIAQVERIAREARLDVGGIEYLVDDRDGQHYFYDINALSNFVADAPNVVGFDPWTRFADYLEARAGLARAAAA